jgi:riboflavin biosynthesis pyrimidine reductase
LARASGPPVLDDTNVPKPDYTSLDLPQPPPERPYVIMNMITSVDGRAVVDDSEAGLGSDTDRRLMRELRVNADVVLGGAATMRRSGASPRLGGFADLEELRRSRGLHRFPIGAVVTNSGDLPLDRVFFTGDDFRAVVYVGAGAPAKRVAAIRGTGREVFDLPAAPSPSTGEESSGERGRRAHRLERPDPNPLRAMLHHMRSALGARVVLVEGGPTLNGQLLSEGLVDEVFITIGPLIVGGERRLAIVEGTGRPDPRRLQLITAFPNVETSEVYLRYRVVHA